MEHLVTSFSGQVRIRISSLDTNEVEPELISLLASDPTICPHLHLPLQSGCDATLARMRRRYTVQRYRQTLESIAATVPDVCLGADVIVGFPGETDAEFEETCRFISAVPLHYLHVFPFSPRHGTDAATMDNPVDEGTKKERAAHLRAISDSKRRSFVQQFAGTVRPAVIIYPDTVLTDNFIQVVLDQPVQDLSPGSGISVYLNGADESGLAHGQSR